MLSAYVEIVFDNSDNRFPVSIDTLSELAIHAAPYLRLTTYCMPGGPRGSTPAVRTRNGMEPLDICQRVHSMLTAQWRHTTM